MISSYPLALPFLNESLINPCESTTGTLKPVSLGFNSPTRSRGSKVTPEKKPKKSVVSRALRGFKVKGVCVLEKKTLPEVILNVPSSNFSTVGVWGQDFCLNQKWLFYISE